MRLRWMAMPAMATMLAGCGSSGSGLVPVSGTVTLEGKPLAGAQVSFAPAAGNKQGTPGTDITGGSGYYKVMHQGRAGLAPGKYRVVVRKLDANPNDSTGGDPYMASLAARARSAPGVDPAGDVIEGHFEREVPDSGGTLDFDLKTPPPPPPPEPEPPPDPKAKKGKGVARPKPGEVPFPLRYPHAPR
jgi:hypothetical protein